MDDEMVLDRKFCRFDDHTVTTGADGIAGYASLFGQPDQGGDLVQKGAYARALARFRAEGRQIRMLWQHDPAQPIGVWDEVREDARGLWVKGRLLEGVARAREAQALIGAGAIDGLSIGYRTIRATKNDKGQRLLTELELWEVSLVTFPMLPGARVGRKADQAAVSLLRELAGAFADARREMMRM